MMTGYLSDSEAHVRIAELMRRIAHDCGKDFDFAGCRAAIAADRHDGLDELMRAAALCAADRDAATPAALSWDRFWTSASVHMRSQRPSDPAWPFCSIPGHPRIKRGSRCWRCDAEAVTDSKAAPPVELDGLRADEAEADRAAVSSGAAVVRAALAATRGGAA